MIRTAIKWLSYTLLVLLALVVTQQCFLPLVAFIFPALDTTFFDFGLYGPYPTQHYQTFSLDGPLPRRIQWHESCDKGLILLSPNGPSVDRPGPMIVDGEGDMIWKSDDFRSTANLKVQRYRDENYLTFWSGDKAATSGKGVYHMLDSTYQRVRTVSAVGANLFGDLHEFKITENTALLTVYNTTQSDLTGMGLGRGRGGWIIDNLIQEVNIETGELLFQWKASDHFDPAATFMADPLSGRWESMPLDWYHINSIDKDSHGNYLISSRHFHSLTCISPHGETLWILGGRDNQFTDLSEGQATNFKWQHDARWVSEEDGIVTLLDNGKAGPLHVDASHSRALFLQLDVEKRTVKLVRSLVSKQGILASSQGSVQVLDSGRTFTWWGSAAAWSEHSKEGALMCETHLGASLFFSLERFKSYRGFKTMDWIGMPLGPPSVKIKGNVLYVSWNGATEVAYWSLEMCRDEQSRESGDPIFESIDIVPKAGFETNFILPSMLADEQRSFRFRVAALDKNHEALRYSDTVQHDNHEAAGAFFPTTMFKIILAIGVFVSARLAVQHWHSRRRCSTSLHSATARPAWMEWQSPSPGRSVRGSGLYRLVQIRWTRATSRPG